jgi:GDPmannose 4,6-dehydratase
MTSVVIGSNGQDGHYLCELLGARGDEVIGVSRGACASSRAGALAPVDLLDRAALARLLAAHRPDEIYYLAASHGAAEAAAGDTHALYRRAIEAHVDGLLNVLDGAERHCRGARIFYAGSSHMFGNAPGPLQNEDTPFAPVCAYGITKTAGAQLCRFYRSRGLYCSVGILYNHESPRRPLPFVSRKIAQAAAAIKRGADRKLVLGNLAAAVDWGAAEDYVDAMARILRLEQPADYVIASGRLRTVREFVQAAFAAVGLRWEAHVEEDPSLLKGAPRPPLCGDATRLREASGWQPAMGFAEMVRRMVAAELSDGKAAAA